MLELTPIQKKTLTLFAKSSLKNKFYLTGDTLLSFFYLGHRRSEDLDFFSSSPVVYNQIAPFIHDLKRQLKLTNLTEKRIYDRWEFFLTNKQNLRLEFVFYDFPKLKPRKKWKGILVDSLDDIAANKTMSLFDRNNPKDLVDLYFLLTRRKYKIGDLLKLVKKKFGLRVEETSFWSESLKALSDTNKVKPLLITKNSKEKQKIFDEIKDYFSSRSADYLHEVLE